MSTETALHCTDCELKYLFLNSNVFIFFLDHTVFSAGILGDINSIYHLNGIRVIKMFTVNPNFLNDSKNLFYKNLR